MNDDLAEAAKVLGVSRPTVDVYLADASKMTAEKIDRLAHHLEFVKAAILTTEARHIVPSAIRDYAIIVV